jgi:polyribonucleotide nucleotidyltransferase
MFTTHKVEKEIGGKVISLETGKIARQSHGAIVARCGDTMVLVTAVTAPPRSEDIDYFPLSVDYREKLSAAGKFPGGFMKREGRPSAKEILTSRMIDRPIRPLFPEGYFNEVQILVSVISADRDYDPDVLSIIGASAALSISKIPFQGPVGACRLSLVDDRFVLFPTYSERDRSTFNLTLAGRKEAINMIEVDARQVSEEKAAEAIAFAHKTVGEVCDMIAELQSKCGVQKEMDLIQVDEALAAEVADKIRQPLREAFSITGKTERNEAVKAVLEGAAKEYCEAAEGREPRCTPVILRRITERVQREVVREMILNGRRPDGRGFTEIRPIECEVGILPRAHGSALFTRGETQALVSVTLGTGRDEQTVDGLLEEYGQTFMLHYNFPPSSVGEVRPIRGPGRREIGHGALAEKALERVGPSEEEFPYTIKVVSDITESNGSSSMASVCGGSLALMDAGVPMREAVAGISIGLVGEKDRHVLLTDIIGDEDHFGDMDFKVAGTAKGITAIQLDIKAEGLAHDILVEALQQAKEARLKILDIMSRVIDKPREALSIYAPKIVTIKIDPEYIGKVIGPGGKMIKSIQDQTNSLIEIEEDGTVCISCVGGEGHFEAREIIEAMTTPPQVGKIYKTAKVVSVKEFGVFVEISPGVEGLCHISELAPGYVKNAEEVCKVGDIIAVKLLHIDEQGRFKLSRKAALAELSGAAPQKSKAKPRPAPARE